MRKYFFILLISAGGLGIYLNAQNSVKESLVPEVVKTSFKQKYPEIKSASWHLEEEKYEAFFKEGGKTVEAIFDSMGNYLSTQTVVHKKELPPVVIAGLSSSQFSDWKIHDAAFVETAENKSYYKLEMLSGKNEIELFFDMEGNVVSH